MVDVRALPPLLTRFSSLQAVLPFAVIGSNCVIESGEGGAAAAAGKRVRGRQYPWGTVEVENTKHCDFTKLRLFLLK